ncbi:hypothetical protein JVU11DRAFT_933 [Chiua virens]|nr:hypothetical protein JVU11DRAFT_933 [Chiua virens]
MEHWPGHETQLTDQSKDKGKQKEHHLESNLWQWPHLEYGSIGRATLVAKDGRARWSTVVDGSRHTRWLPLDRPTKVFPETRPPQVNIHEHSTHQRAEKGLQYLRAYFPDADFPGELLGSALKMDARDVRRSNEFDPFIGSLLEIVPSHLAQDEYTVVFPMGDLGRELNISRLNSSKSGSVVFNPAGSSSFAFETPILQISSAVGPPHWISTPYSTLLIRTHTSASLFRLAHSKVTGELDITRTETGDIPIVDCRILASGPDIIVVNRSGRVYKCNTYRGSKAMQLICAREVSDDDHFFQLGITPRSDECFLASCRSVQHIDLRSRDSFRDIFSLEYPSTTVTSFESPKHDYISRITTTSDIIWLDDRFRRRPILSYKHHRSFDRTLRVISADVGGTSLSLLTSRRNGFVTLYDVSRDTDGLLHCNSIPSCLPCDGPMFTTYDGHALVPLPSNVGLTFLRLCQRGSIYRQDIRVAGPDEDQPGSIPEDHVTHQWDENVLNLEKQANELRTDFGPAGGRLYTEVNLRGAYEKLFDVVDDAEEDVDRNAFQDVLVQLPSVWQDPETEKNAENMLTTLDVVFSTVDGDARNSLTNFLSGNLNPKHPLDTLNCGYPAMQRLAGLAQWHYDIRDTSIPTLDSRSFNSDASYEYLKELDLVPGVERHDPSVRRETEAREQLVLDLTLSTDVYSARPLAQLNSLSEGGETSDTVAHPVERLYSEEPPEVKFGYFRPIRKIGANHYADKEQGEQDPTVSSPLGVRLLLAEWELGTDPADYTYRDPYGVATIVAQPIPQYRKPLAAPAATQKKQTQLQQPPPIVVAATQPPVVHTAERAPSRIQSQTTHSQQQLEPDIDAFAQEPMTSTQVLPGPFGGRPGAAGKKPTKKRIGGF